MPRKLRPSRAPSDMGVCKIHGLTELRWHKMGKKNRWGGQWVCPPCNRARVNQHRREELPLPVSPSVGHCGVEIRYRYQRFFCWRPQGHPPDVHRTVDKVEWKVNFRPDLIRRRRVPTQPLPARGGNG